MDFIIVPNLPSQRTSISNVVSERPLTGDETVTICIKGLMLDITAGVESRLDYHEGKEGKEMEKI